MLSSSETNDASEREGRGAEGGTSIEIAKLASSPNIALLARAGCCVNDTGER